MEVGTWSHTGLLQTAERIPTHRKESLSGVRGLLTRNSDLRRLHPGHPLLDRDAGTLPSLPSAGILRTLRSDQILTLLVVGLIVILVAFGLGASEKGNRK